MRETLADIFRPARKSPNQSDPPILTVHCKASSVQYTPIKCSESEILESSGKLLLQCIWLYMTYCTVLFVVQLNLIILELEHADDARSTGVSAKLLLDL